MRRLFSIIALLVGVLLLVGAGVARHGTPAQAAGPAPLPAWHDTGLVLPELRRPLCIDPLHAHTVLLADAAQGTFAVDWQTDVHTAIHSRPFDLCALSGWLYTSDNQGRGPFFRFRLDTPAAEPIDHPPTDLAQDGSAIVYSLSADDTAPHRQLWASLDGGRTWLERGQPFGGHIETITVAAADARVLYTLVLNEMPAPTGQVTYSIYASADAGATWDRRSQSRMQVDFNGARARFYLSVVPGPTAPVDTLILQSDVALTSFSHHQEMLLSTDGGASFHPAGMTESVLGLQFGYTQEGVVRLTQQVSTDRNFVLQAQHLDLSTDGGRTWQPLPAPPAPAPGIVAHPDYLIQAPAAPVNLFLYNSDSGTPLKYTPDGGHTWQQFANATDGRLYPAPYLPLSLLGTRRLEPRDPGYSTPGPGTPPPGSTPLPGQTAVPGGDPNNHLFVLDLPAAGTHVVAPAPPSNAPGSRYFPATGHNLGAVFRVYWEAHGGLAQFGNPRTEPLREVNAADGKVYLTQYFERNRFEYHSEFAGSPYEVELGLLGNEQTAGRRAAGDGAFNRFADAHYPGGTYFPPTGHNLRNSFQAYWQAHGGLALYGYPISEEFEEVSPTDGQRYVVQYFERNRFEYHPENRGSPYEVLLGLLGNTLLEQKGWH